MDFSPVSPNSYRYIPVYTEIEGAYEIITGLFQRSYGNWMDDTWGLAHPRGFTIMYDQQEGQRKIDSGMQKFIPGALAAAVVALAIL